MNAIAQPVLQTERLLLRPFAPDDAPAVEALCGAFEVADTTLSIPHPYPPGMAAAWIESHTAARESGTGVSYAVTDRRTGELLGAVGVSLVPEHARAELGYWIAVPQWGKGYGTEAARAVLGVAFDTLGVHRVQARHLTRNPASGRVMQKLGMRFEGILRGAMKKWDTFEDVAMYAMLEDEWHERSATRSDA
ncbi:MAG TPA: GNAT family N-acetyltransferase [Gemmatimonadaceae bacterium]|nr:GNAT family N-acetyltransferase [Gemmatimonadaceae bacterium]